MLDHAFVVGDERRVHLTDERVRASVRLVRPVSAVVSLGSLTQKLPSCARAFSACESSCLPAPIYCSQPTWCARLLRGSLTGELKMPWRLSWCSMSWRSSRLGCCQRADLTIVSACSAHLSRHKRSAQCHPLCEALVAVRLQGRLCATCDATHAT